MLEDLLCKEQPWHWKESESLADHHRYFCCHKLKLTTHNINACCSYKTSGSELTPQGRVLPGDSWWFNRKIYITLARFFWHDSEYDGASYLVRELMRLSQAYQISAHYVDVEGSISSFLSWDPHCACLQAKKAASILASLPASLPTLLQEVNPYRTFEGFFSLQVILMDWLALAF